jgi:hypothetical protein
MRVRRRLALALAVAVAVVLGTYLAFPWLLGGLAPLLADRLGIETLVLESRRPGVNGITVDRVVLGGAGWRLVGEGGRIGYRLAALPSRRLDAVHFQRVRLVLDRPAEHGTATAPESAGHTGEALLPDLEDLFQRLPARRLAVERLEVAVPALDLLARGRLAMTPRLLETGLEAVAPARAAGHVLEARLGRDRRARLVVADGQAAGPPLLDLTAVRLPRSLAVGGTFALDLPRVAQLLKPRQWPSGQGTVAGSFAATLPWPLPARPAWHAVSAGGDVRGRWRTASGVAVQGAEARWRLDTATFSGRATTVATLDGTSVRLALGVESLDPVALTGRGRITVDPLAAAGGGSAAAGAAPSPALDLAWHLVPDRLELDGGYRVGEVVAELLAERLSIIVGRGTLTGRVKAALPRPMPRLPDLRTVSARGSIGGRWQRQALALDDLRGDWALRDGRLTARTAALVRYRGLETPLRLELAGADVLSRPVTAQGMIGLGDLAEAELQATYRPESGAGELTARGAIGVEGPLAGGLVPGWSEPYDLTAGTAEFAAELAWTEPHRPNGTVRLTVTEAAGHYGDRRARGIGAELTATVAEGAWTLQPSTLTVDTVDVGVALTDVAAGLAWDGEVVAVSGARAGLLGGAARLAPFDYRIRYGEAFATVVLEDLSLAAILALQAEHVSGAGRLDGVLPVTLSDHVPTISDGWIRADPPGGIIRLSPELAAETGQPGLDLALTALEDFRYSVLAADVAYGADGELTLAVHLEGRNPQVEGGRPIHFNLKLTQNLPALLKALRLQEEVTRGIERRVTD